MIEFTKRKTDFLSNPRARKEMVGHAMKKMHRRCWRSRPFGHMYRRDDIEPGAVHWSQTCVGCGKVKLRELQ